MIPQSAFGWLSCRPIKPLVVHLPTFLWLNVGVFSKLIGKSYYMFLSGCCYVGTVGSM